jgi:hypothetical protein
MNGKSDIKLDIKWFDSKIKIAKHQYQKDKFIILKNTLININREKKLKQIL